MASKKIRGITIEIDGNTQGLNKALETTEKEITSTNGELKEINKLLKFDPKNTELLGQKQTVLAKNINATREKLEKLKAAQKQVEQQFENKEIDDGTYRAFRREIEKTESQLKELEEQGKKSNKALGNLGNAFSAGGKAALTTGKAVAVGIAAIGSGAVYATESSREYREEMNKLTSAFEVNGYGADTAKKAYLDLFGVIGETDQAVEASQQISLLADSEKNVYQWSGLAAGVVARFGDALQPETFFEAANETIKLGTATGAYTQMLEGCGYSVDAFNAGLSACNSEEEKQQYMLNVTNELLGEASQKYKETNKDIISQREAIDKWNVSLAKVGAVTEPVIAEITTLGADGVAALAEGLTLALDGNVGEAVALIGNNVSNLVEGISNTADTLTDMAAPIIQGFIQGLNESIPLIAPVAVNIVVKICETILATAPTLLTAAVTLITELAKALGNGFKQLFPEVISELIAMIVDLLENTDEIIGALVGLITDIIDGLLEAVPLLVSALPNVVTALVEALVNSIPLILNGATKLVEALRDGLIELLPMLSEVAPEIVESLINGISDELPNILDGAIQLVLTLVESVTELIPLVVEVVPELIAALLVALFDSYPQLADCGVQLIESLALGLIEALPILLEYGKTSTFSFINLLVTSIPLLVEVGYKYITGVIGGMSTAFKGTVSIVQNIGKNLVEGLFKGIKNAETWLREKLKEWCGGILENIKEFFGIHSPSKETEYFGKMIAEGLAIGIEENMTPEEVLKKKCDNLKSILDNFVSELSDKQDLHDTWLELWELENPDASPIEKLGMAYDMVNAQIKEQDDIVAANKAAWDAAKKEFGEGSSEAREYEGKYAKSLISKKTLENKKQNIVNEALEREKYGGLTLSEYENQHKDDYSDADIYSLRVDRNQWLSKNAAPLLEMGMTYDEVVKKANKATGYDKAEMQINNKTEVKITNGSAYDKFKVKEIDNQTEAVYV